MITLYHNPKCSKSREALALLEKLAVAERASLNVIEYLKKPLNATQLAQLHKLTEGDLLAMIRQNEAVFSELDLANANYAELLAAVAAHPVLLQRPIVLYKGKAVVARPLERMLSLFTDALVEAA